jgi:Uma2 family endonuclease
VNPTSYRAARVTARILRLLDTSAEAHGLGDVVGPDAGFVIFPDENTLVAPDVSFISRHHVPPAEDQVHFARLAPDVVVEVMFPTDRMTDVLRKINLYLEAGVTLAWLIDPQKRTANVFRQDESPITIHDDGVLAGDEILPGFSLPLARLFA